MVEELQKIENERDCGVEIINFFDKENTHISQMLEIFNGLKNKYNNDIENVSFNYYENTIDDIFSKYSIHEKERKIKVLKSLLKATVMATLEYMLLK